MNFPDNPNRAQYRCANINFGDDGIPRAVDFDDVYFSTDDGLAESKNIFLAGNQLPQRWQTLQRGDNFTIAELGFGSGLNFLACWQLWQQRPRCPGQLNFISVEKFPLRKSDLIKILSRWSELDQLREKLTTHYPELPTPGFHVIELDFNVRLVLIFDDALDGLKQLLWSDHPGFQQTIGPAVNAWFLDGFAPQKNPALWTAELCQLMAGLSADTATCATFSVARMVKDHLQRAGFVLEKKPGYGRKREMLTGHYRPIDEPIAQPAYRGRPETPWFVCRRQASSNRALIIGAGLAGCHSAYALAKRGWQVTVIDAGDQPGSGASGNPQGVLYARLSIDNDPLARFNLSSLQFACDFYKPFWARTGFGSRCGVLQLAYNPRSAELMEQLANLYGDNNFVQLLTSAAASERCGKKTKWGGLFFPECGWLNPRHLCEDLLAHENIEFIGAQSITALQHQHDNWRACHGDDEIASACTLIIANAQQALNFHQCQHLPLKAIRGQISIFDRHPELAALTSVVCGQSSVTPATDGVHVMGASFTLRNHDPAELQSDHEHNIKQLQSLFHDPVAITASSLRGRVGFRCVSPDYLPLVGPAPIGADFIRQYHPLAKNALCVIDCPGSYYPNLYLNLAHGSKGLASTPLAAELLAAQITGDTLPMSRALAQALSPARFLIRDISRRKFSYCGG